MRKKKHAKSARACACKEKRKCVVLITAEDWKRKILCVLRSSNRQGYYSILRVWAVATSAFFSRDSKRDRCKRNEFKCKKVRACALSQMACGWGNINQPKCAEEKKTTWRKTEGKQQEKLNQNGPMEMDIQNTLCVRLITGTQIKPKFEEGNWKREEEKKSSQTRK